METKVKKDLRCYHCGDACDDSIFDTDKYFCCEGCHQVYLLLEENQLCTYYDLDKNPGIKTRGRFQSGKFAYLDNESIIRQLVRFTDGQQSHVLFYLPTMHCASCIWLLENLHRLQPGIISSRVNFQRKEVFIVFQNSQISLRQLVELLAFTGYEPYISLDQQNKKDHQRSKRLTIYRIGVAGFCFGNIMMLSFPEYFSNGKMGEEMLRQLFSYLNLVLALPVFFFCAAPFFVSAWQGLKQKWLNIDAPISLAILVTFGRSLFEILGHTGAGYFDSMSGIVFFMLIGRWFQDRTYDSISFDRDYKSYFPLGITRLKDGVEDNILVSELSEGDRIVVRHEEMIPADAILRKGRASIDYSFVSGETTPVGIEEGDLVYAGGKQIGPSIELEVITTVSRSYITQLWNHDIFQQEKHPRKSFVHPLSRYFTYLLFGIASLTAIYWAFQDPSKIWYAVTAVLIIACPCSLLLSATFTYGNMLGIFGHNRLYLKNAGVIESLGTIDTIVFDKTGTLTHHDGSLIHYDGTPLTEKELSAIKKLSGQSAHPLSRLISDSLGETGNGSLLILEEFREESGKGIRAIINHQEIKMGSSSYIGGQDTTNIIQDTGTYVFLQIDGETRGRFSISNEYRENLAPMMEALKQNSLQLHVLSGDNSAERDNIESMVGKEAPILFRQSPSDKLNYISKLQAEGHRVLMLGDGLNDAGALRQSHVGIAVTDQRNLFSPASDGILDGSMVNRLPDLIGFAGIGKRIVFVSFIYSILYNILGLYFATQARLSPVIAAILMPASSISIVLLVTIYSRLSARLKNLKV